MHGGRLSYINEAVCANWVSTVCANIDEVEAQIVSYVGCKYAVGLNCGTASLHLATCLVAGRLYGQDPTGKGTFAGRRVLCSDMTFDASINPMAYESGKAVFWS